jgi:hypothetical protein
VTGVLAQTRAQNSFGVSCHMYRYGHFAEMLLSDSVHQVIRYAYATMRNKASNKVARTSAGKCDIEKDHVIWCVFALYIDIE